jgi:hypothetical protein
VLSASAEFGHPPESPSKDAQCCAGATPSDPRFTGPRCFVSYSRRQLLAKADIAASRALARHRTAGTGRVARAAPDGYTVILGHWQTHVVNGATYTLPFDVIGDVGEQPSRTTLVIVDMILSFVGGATRHFST